MSDVTLQQASEALDRIREWIQPTPVLRSDRLDEITGARLFFKCENLQKTGSFKARGALNTVFSLSEAQASHGVATHSSGNHGAALAWAAAMRGIPATAVMPSNANPVKVAAVKGYGGTVIFCEPNHKAREETAAKFISETGAHMVHPYNDVRIIAGQGTVALEFLREVPDLDAIVTPVGGGGPPRWHGDRREGPEPGDQGLRRRAGGGRGRQPVVQVGGPHAGAESEEHRGRPPCIRGRHHLPGDHEHGSTPSPRSRRTRSSGR
jgi:hypothetical protein